MLIKVKVLELNKKLFQGESTKIVVPATDGEICILPNHMSIITSMKSGIIKIYREEVLKPVSIPISKGICSFSDNSAVFIV